MTKLDFEGRYVMTNGTIVAVHCLKPVHDSIVTSISHRVAGNVAGAVYWGHELRMEPPYEIDDMYYWNATGHCVAMELKHLGATSDHLTDFDLVHCVGQSEAGYSVEVVDCLHCMSYMRSRKG